MTTIIRYEGRGAVVTGGASGIGLRTAERIIAEGGSVSIWDIDPIRVETACKNLGTRAHGITAIMRKLLSLANALLKAKRKWTPNLTRSKRIL